MSGVPVTPYAELPKPNAKVSRVGATAAGIAAGRGAAVVNGQ
jgi:hypothetical protein